jgi:hypothetical protein
VPDNAKVAVIKACLYEPQVDRTYAEMAAHYDTAILDRLVHNAHRIDLAGDSLRRTQPKSAMQD